MKRWILISAMLMAPALSGCLFADPDPKTEPCVGEACKPDPTERPLLKASVLSGHLGNYRDCPNDALEGVGAQGDAAGLCAEVEGEDFDGCGGPLNCEDPMVTVSMSNGGDADALGLTVDKIELLTTSGDVVAELALIELIRLDEIDGILQVVPFDGTIEQSIGTRLDLRIQGLNDLTILQDPGADEGARLAGTGGIIRVTFSAENHDDVIVESMELFDLPSVDT